MRLFAIALTAVVALLWASYIRADVRLRLDHVEFNTPRIVAQIPPPPPPGRVTLVDKQITARDAETLCLAQVVYYEARGEPIEGQVAVAEVVVNRSRSGAYPSSLCAVAYQPGQFALTIEDRLAPPRGKAWKRAQVLAARVISGRQEKPFGGRATHFHNVSVTPYWSEKFRVVGRIGDHVFYQDEI